jgi:hypothetical protein
LMGRREIGWDGLARLFKTKGRGEWNLKRFWKQGA